MTDFSHSRASMPARLHVSGRAKLVSALELELRSTTEPDGTFWLGLFTYGCFGFGTHAAPSLAMDVRDGVRREDAVAALHLGLSRVANRYDLSVDSGGLEVTYEDQTGQEHRVDTMLARPEEETVRGSWRQTQHTSS